MSEFSDLGRVAVRLASKRGQKCQNIQTAELVHRSAKKAFQASGISSQVCSSMSSRISLYCQSFTTTKSDLIGGTPFCSKVHDPFPLRGLNPRQLREGYSSSSTSGPYFPGFVGPNHPGLCVVALQHLPYFVHDDVWPPTSSSQVRMYWSNQPNTRSSVAADLASASSKLICIFFRRARASSSSFLSLRVCLRSFLMSRLSSSSCFSSWAANSASFSVSASLLARGPFMDLSRHFFPFADIGLGNCMLCHQLLTHATVIFDPVHQSLLSRRASKTALFILTLDGGSHPLEDTEDDKDTRCIVFA